MAVTLLLGAAYTAFRSPRIQKRMTQWLVKKLSATYNTKISVEGVDIDFFKGLVLKKLLIEDQQKDTLFAINRASFQLDSLNFLKGEFYIGNIELDHSTVRIKKMDDHYNFQFLFSPPDTTSQSSLKLSFKNIYLKDSRVTYSDLSLKKDSITKGVNFKDLDFNQINLSLLNIHSADPVKEFTLDNASFTEKSGIKIHNLKVQVKMDSSGVQLKDFALIASHSHLEASQINISPNKLFTPDTLNANNSILNKFTIDGNFKESLLSLSDLAYVIPDIWGMNEPVLFSGKVSGSLNNLKLKEINVKIGKNTQLNADLELKGLPDVKNTYVYFKLYKNVFNFQDLAAIRLPEKSAQKYLKIPKPLLQDLKLTYQGNFTGFPSDFVAYGTIGGDLGQLSTDIAIKPKKANDISFSGKLVAKSFQIGRLLNYEPLGAVSLGIQVN